MTRCYLGLGSNLGSPERQLNRAIASLHKLPHSSILQLSSVYYSQPLGVRSQPIYCNRVIEIQTALAPTALLHYCQTIENKHQRIRKRHWGARTVDIDILLYGNKIIDTRDLSIPHRQMLKRDFVLVPLLEISPSVCLPNGESIQAYLTGIETYLISRPY